MTSVILLLVARQRARRARSAPTVLLRSEHAHQARFCQALRSIEHPAARSVFAIPNGALGPSQKRKFYFIAEGVSPGAPDLMIAFPGFNGSHGLFLEFKYGNNTPTKEQIEWLARLKKNGYAVAVVYSWVEALEHFCRHVGIAPPELLT